MNKKLILAIVLAGGLYYAFGRKKDEPETDGDYEENQSLSHLERKVVITEAGRVFVIVKGYKFAVTSDAALDDYIASNPDISRAAMGTSESEISNLPMGALYPKLVFHYNDQPINI